MSDTPFSPGFPDSWAAPRSSAQVVVVAASAGGLVPLGELLSSLPADFPAAVVVIQHRGRDQSELLPKVLAKRTRLRVRHARDGDVLAPGTVYVCPPGVHLTTEHSLRLVHGPRVNFVSPSADPTLQSAAQTYGPNVVAVVLSGTGRDGENGCAHVASGGGAVLVQEPSSCEHAGMPESVIRRGVAAQVLPIPALVEELLRRTSAPIRALPAVVPAPTRVLLVDDHRMLRDGLRTLLRAEPDIEVVAEAGDGEEAVRVAVACAPDVIVMDISMPRVDGIEATRRLRALAPQARVLALSAHADSTVAERAIDAGMSGFLDKNAAFSELARAIRAVASGENYTSFRISPRGAEG